VPMNRSNAWPMALEEVAGSPFFSLRKGHEPDRRAAGAGDGHFFAGPQEGGDASDQGGG
jgi:hypothetical protein